MRIPLDSPDSAATRNFMPRLCMFLLQALTPKERGVAPIGGNTRPMAGADRCPSENWAIDTDRKREFFNAGRGRAGS